MITSFYDDDHDYQQLAVAKCLSAEEPLHTSQNSLTPFFIIIFIKLLQAVMGLFHVKWNVRVRKTTHKSMCKT